MGEANSDSESLFNNTEDELTLLIIPSIHTLGKNKKKYSWLEKRNLVREPAEFKIFSETLNTFIENESVIAYTFRNCEYMWLSIENFREIETEKEDIKEQFHQFKSDFFNEFNEFKTKFLPEVKSDNIVFLILHQETQEARKKTKP